MFNYKKLEEKIETLEKRIKKLEKDNQIFVKVTKGYDPYLIQPEYEIPHYESTKKQLLKLKGIVAELSDYVYKESK